MKLKSLLFLVSFGLFSNVFAANLHMHPKADSADRKAVTSLAPGYCQITVLSSRYNDVVVNEVFDDGATDSFVIYSNEYPHYISLFYNGYCHQSMFISIQSYYYTHYAAYTAVGSVIPWGPYLKVQAKS